jgi:hypothetical protein
MSDISIDKKTGISIGLLIILAPVFFWAVTTWARLESKVEGNTADIASMVNSLGSLTETLTETNGNVIALSTKLDGIAAQLSPASIDLTPFKEASTVFVTTSEGMQPHPRQHGPSPTQPEMKPQEPETEPGQEGPAAEEPAFKVVDALLGLVGL